MTHRYDSPLLTKEAVIRARAMSSLAEQEMDEWKALQALKDERGWDDENDLFKLRVKCFDKKWNKLYRGENQRAAAAAPAPKGPRRKYEWGAFHGLREMTLSGITDFKGAEALLPSKLGGTNWKALRGNRGNNARRCYENSLGVFACISKVDGVFTLKEGRTNIGGDDADDDNDDDDDVDVDEAGDDEPRDDPGAKKAAAKKKKKKEEEEAAEAAPAVAEPAPSPRRGARGTARAAAAVEEVADKPPAKKAKKGRRA